MKPYSKDLRVKVLAAVDRGQLDRITVTADGQRFLINAIVETQLAAPLTVVVNWTAELKR